MRKSLVSQWSLIAILVVAVGLRLYRVSNPISDWHAFRQADTASVTREYVKHGIDLLRPTYQDHSNIQSGKDNPQGYRMVEFPLINGMIALVLRTFPGLPLVVTSRIFSIAASVGTMLALYQVVKKVSDQRLAYLSVLVMGILPYSIYYSRAVLPEPYMLLFSTLSLAAMITWFKQGGWRWYGLSLLSLMIAVLLKPFVLFLAPVYLVLAIQKWRWQVWRQWPLLIYGVVAILPFWWWREWIKQFPEGIPASDWLLNGNGIRFRPAWFRWLFWERLTKLILGTVGMVALPLNLGNRKSDIWVYGAWWVGILAYFMVVASGNVQHDYYQNLALPIICISLARGLLVLFDWLQQRMSQLLAGVVVAGILGLTVYFSWGQVGGYFNVNHWEYVAAGQRADSVLPADALVIAPAFGDTQFLFQTNRTGWPIGFEIPLKIAKGAQYYVTASDDDEARMLAREYQVIDRGEGYLIINLQQPIATESTPVAP